MNSGARKADGWQAVLTAFAFLALALRVLVPTGYMPGGAQTGGFPLVICTGHGPMVIDGPDLEPHRAPTKAASHAPCAFAGHGAGAVLGDTPWRGAVGFAVFTAIVPTALSEAPHDLAAAAQPPPSTGPPPAT